MLLDLLLGRGGPLVVARRFDGFDDAQTVLGQGFGGGAVGGLGRQGLEQVEGGAVEVEQGGAWGWVGEEAR